MEAFERTIHNGPLHAWPPAEGVLHGPFLPEEERLARHQASVAVAAERAGEAALDAALEHKHPAPNSGYPSRSGDATPESDAAEKKPGQVANSIRTQPAPPRRRRVVVRNQHRRV